MKKSVGNISSTINPDDLKKFKKIASEMGKRPSQLVREFVIATIENRVKITINNVESYKNMYQ